MSETRKVVCAALRSRQTGKIVCGARHYDDVMRALIFVDGKRPDDWKCPEQGFIDQHCVFLTRQEAWDVAKAAGQLPEVLRDKYSQGTLFSEDLY